MRLPFARSYERQARLHAGAVYRYALAVLQDPAEAEEATRAVYREARRALEAGQRPDDTRSWLIAIAHGVCSRRSRRSPPQAQAPPATGCLEAERALAKDDPLPSGELALLRGHLRTCGECRRVVWSHRAQRLAFRALATIPLPRSLWIF